jgi:2-alkenal reductase
MLNKTRHLFLLLILILSLFLAACSDNNTATTVTTTPSTTNAGTNVAATQSTAVAAVTATPTPAPVLSADQLESNSVVGVVKQYSPAVVTIYNKATRAGVANSQITRGTGSGTIISEDGYIVTNAHVVEGEQALSVAFNNGQKIVSAKVIGVDTEGDLAVIKVEGKVPAVLKFGDSSKVEVGETVIAVGAALGDFRNSVTKGVISGINRTIPGDTTPSVYLQTDAPINHGNSGGPLLNLRGEVVGINTAVLRSTGSGGSANADLAEGLGFAIPSNTVKIVSDQLISTGNVSRPYFGIRYQMITPALAGTNVAGISIPEVEGAWINSSGSRNPGIVKDGPADKAGLKENDIVTAIDGIALNDTNPLVTAILKYKPNTTIDLTVQRGTQALTLKLTLGERPKATN